MRGGLGTLSTVRCGQEQGAMVRPKPSGVAAPKFMRDDRGTVKAERVHACDRAKGTLMVAVS